MSELETMKVNNPADPGGYMIINKSDFDPKKHRPFEKPSREPKAPKEPKE